MSPWIGPTAAIKSHARCGRSDFQLLGLPAEEFPASPEVEATATLLLEGGSLKAMIRHVLFAVSTDETRVILTGVLLKVEGNTLKLVATDTHRLAVRSGALAKAEGGDAQAVIPARAMNELMRLVGDDDAVTISLAQGQARFEIHARAGDKEDGGIEIAGLTGKFRASSTTMVTRLIEGGSFRTTSA